MSTIASATQALLIAQKDAFIAILRARAFLDDKVIAPIAATITAPIAKKVPCRKNKHPARRPLCDGDIIRHAVRGKGVTDTAYVLVTIVNGVCILADCDASGNKKLNGATYDLPSSFATAHMRELMASPFPFPRGGRQSANTNGWEWCDIKALGRSSWHPSLYVKAPRSRMGHRC